MARNVVNEKIERNYYEQTITQRVQRTIRVAKTCLAATAAGAFIGAMTKNIEAVAVVVPSSIVGVAERRRSMRVLDDLVFEFGAGISSSNRPYESEKAYIEDGALQSVRFIDISNLARTQDLTLTVAQQSGGWTAGLFSGAVAGSQHAPEALAAPTLAIAGITGALAVGAMYLDSRDLRDDYLQQLQNVEGVQSIG